MSASARSPSASAVVAELHSRHATEVRSYVLELWTGDEVRTEESVAVFWRDWVPPPGSADEIPREIIFAGVRRQAVADQRRHGSTEPDTDEGEAADSKDPAAQVAARFRRLTAKQQEMVRLQLRHRFNTDESAEIAELSNANAAQLLHTAICRLNGKSHNEDARLVALALAGATGEQVERETPEVRTRIAELRLTVEVTRQVLARGVDAYRPRKHTVRRRAPRLLAWVLGIVVLAGGGWWWLARTDSERGDATAIESSGAERVAINRTAQAPDGRASSLEGQLSAEKSTGRNSSAKTKPSVAVAQKNQRDNSGSSTAAKRGAAEQMGTEATRSAVAPERIPRETQPAETTRRTLPATEDSGTAIWPANAAPRTAAPTAALAAGSRAAPNAARDAGAVSASTNPEALRSDAARPLVAMRTPTRQSARADMAALRALRGALNAARWPARQDVRVAELINRVPAQAKIPVPNGEPFATRVEASEAPWDPTRQLVRVTVQARDDAPIARAAATVILLLDVSGSMEAPNRLPLVQEAVAALLRRLRPEDRVGIVTYAGESTVLLPATKLTDEASVRAALDALEAKGRTNGGAGLRQAFAMAASETDAARTRVVILCTDGDFNMGETTEAQLTALIDAQRERGVKLAIFGFGRAEQIDPRLEALAARAQGGSGYVNTRAEAEQALVAQLDALFAPVATALEATVEFDPTRVAKVRPLGEAQAVAAGRGVKFPVVQRARVLPGETMSTLFEIEPVPGPPPENGEAWTVRANGVLPERAEAEPYEGRWAGSAPTRAFAEAAVDFRFAAAAAAFGEALQAGQGEGTARLDDIERWASAALGEDAGGYRAEFLRWIEQARRAETQ